MVFFKHTLKVIILFPWVIILNIKYNYNKIDIPYTIIMPNITFEI